jgi:pSer/pThr/pTyr-binding forkhead associated (FHA) protein
MRFRLVIEKNGKRSRVVELSGTQACIGRAHGNEVRIPSADVSRRHCQLRVDEGLLKIEDLESVNGTYLNGDLLTGEAVLRPGDRLEVGPVQFMVEYELTPNAVERLRAMDYEVVVEDEDTEAVVASDEDEDEPEVEEPPPSKRKGRRQPVQEEEIAETEAVEDDDILEAEEAVEAEDYSPRINLDEVKWSTAGDGDLRDMLSQLDEGQESLMPRKRPAPRPRKPSADDWPDDRRNDMDEPPKPKSKDGKRRPKAEDE